MPTTSPGRRERSKSAKRERIFAAAAELFAQRGFAAVTTREIAERADVADAHAPAERVLALVEPLIEMGREQEENAIVYQRELSFGSADEDYRSQGLDTVVRRERTIAELLRATSPGSEGEALPDEYHAMCTARGIFALVHMATASRRDGITAKSLPRIRPTYFARRSV